MTKRLYGDVGTPPPGRLQSPNLHVELGDGAEQGAHVLLALNQLSWGGLCGLGSPRGPRLGALLCPGHGPKGPLRTRAGVLTVNQLAVLQLEQTWRNLFIDMICCDSSNFPLKQMRFSAFSSSRTTVLKL